MDRWPHQKPCAGSVLRIRGRVHAPSGRLQARMCLPSRNTFVGSVRVFRAQARTAIGLPAEQYPDPRRCRGARAAVYLDRRTDAARGLLALDGIAGTQLGLQQTADGLVSGKLLKCKDRMGRSDRSRRMGELSSGLRFASTVLAVASRCTSFSRYRSPCPAKMRGRGDVPLPNGEPDRAYPPAGAPPWAGYS
jgi:hypothetical protein